MLPDSVLTTGLSAQELKSQEGQDGRGECRKMSCEKQPWGAAFCVCVGRGLPPQGTHWASEECICSR